jgi:uncharacterized phage-associated protein
MIISQPSHPFKFDSEKAVETILYIAQRARIPDFLHICKILYFADKNHLEEYGRFICGDHYIAMSNGPVPSGTYDILKQARITKQHGFIVQGSYSVAPLRGPDLSVLSESDIESLDIAISQYGGMSIGELIEISHDEAWQAADENALISVEKIAATLRDGDTIIDHLHDDDDDMDVGYVNVSR